MKISDSQKVPGGIGLRSTPGLIPSHRRINTNEAATAFIAMNTPIAFKTAFVFFFTIVRCFFSHKLLEDW